ncbi:MAG: adenylosuccinate synthetase, partial [Candidatus Marinimicrobia bacterium]|nr:adenylosuccinate synthetase [Candidatus Neomarinimicrobiota bacterium]
PTVGGAVTGLGVPPQSIRRITGVFKAYTTRVGAGPFPTELTGEEGDLLRQIGMEYGATTGRSRRCGWFDGIAAKYATKLNGFTDIAITKMDILDPYEEIQICTGYHRNKVKKFPFALQNPEAIDPQYQSLSGWRDSTVGITKFEELPTKAMEYIKFIENYLGVNVSLISTGSDSQHLIQIF